MTTRHIQKPWAAVLLAFALISPGPALADTVLWMGGTGGTIARFIPPELFGTPADFLGGAYRDDTFEVVPYPSSLWPITGLFDPTMGQSIAVGVDALKSAVHATGHTNSEPMVIAGVSQGAMVVQQAQAELNDDPTVASDTTFILIADPNRGVFNGWSGAYIPVADYIPRPLSETRFNTVIVTNQYDGFAQPINRPWNLLTDLNAVMGTAYVHPTAHNTDLSAVPESDIIIQTNSQGGTTTSYFVPTEHLPLTMPLRSLGVPDKTVDAIDAALRPAIDAGYQPLPSLAKRSPATPDPRRAKSHDMHGRS